MSCRKTNSNYLYGLFNKYWIITKKRCKEENLPIERCDKCGKSFMSESEVERHKTWEHPIPVSPFEERLAANSGTDSEALHRLTSDVAIGSGISNYYGSSTTIGSGRRKVPFKPFRI